MISYYKHSNGEAFQLNGEDYSGFFNLSGDALYTDRYYNLDSELLTPKKTFISKVFQKGQHFNTTFNGITPLSSYYSNVFDILNVQGINTALDVVDNNNLADFRNLVLYHPVVYRFDENDNHYYGLSSSSDQFVGKKVTSYITSVSNIPQWAFLNDIRTGIFIVNTREDFKYLCSDGVVIYNITASFSDPTIPLVVTVLKDYNDVGGEVSDVVYSISYDSETGNIYVVNNDYISIYDGNNYQDCGKLLIVDRISLIPTVKVAYTWGKTRKKWKDATFKWERRYTFSNQNFPEYIRFGKNIRTRLNDTTLEILNKNSSDVVNVINLSNYFIMGSIIDLDIRDVDDYIMILHQLSDGYYIITFDPTDMSTISNSKLLSIDINQMCRVKFSPIDSDVFSISNKTEYQTRFISRPTYPAGRLELGELLYPKRYKWGDADIGWLDAKFQWDASKNPSNSYNNLLVSEVVKNNKMYMMLHNIGRIYTLHQPVNHRFYNNIPLTVEKNFDGIVYSESSLGLYFNSCIANIVKDVLTLFTQAVGSFSLYETEVIVKQLEDFVLESENLYINGNETINVIALQRIFLILSDIQARLLPNSLKSE